MRGHCQLRSVPCYLFCKNSVASHYSHFYSIYPERNSVQWSKWSTLCSGKTDKTSLQVDVYRRKFYESKFHLLYLENAKGINWGICFLYLVVTFYWDVWLYFSKITYKLISPPFLGVVPQSYLRGSLLSQSHLCETHNSQFLVQWTFDNLTKAGD